MTDIEYCYKVVFIKSSPPPVYVSYIGRYTTASYSLKDDIKPWVLEYRIGKKTKPAGKSKALYAFNAIGVAKNLACNSLDKGECTILKCECSRIDISGLARIMWLTGISSFVDFWEDFDGKKWPRHMGDYAPSGTVLCKWVRPLEVVE